MSRHPCLFLIWTFSFYNLKLCELLNFNYVGSEWATVHGAGRPLFLKIGYYSSPLTGLLNSTFSFSKIGLDFWGWGDRLGRRRPLIGWCVQTEGGIKTLGYCYWSVRRVDAFPSAICLLHLKDNPLEIPPQMFSSGHKAEEEDKVGFIMCKVFTGM